MDVKFKGNKGAVMYRGVGFVNETSSDVTEAWFDACKNPNIVEFVAKKAPVKKTAVKKPKATTTSPTKDKKRTKGFLSRCTG